MTIQLTGILEKRHINASLSVEEESDDFIMLLDPKGYIIARFTQYVLPIDIKRVADEYLNSGIIYITSQMV